MALSGQSYNGAFVMHDRKVQRSENTRPTSESTMLVHFDIWPCVESRHNGSLQVLLGVNSCLVCWRNCMPFSPNHGSVAISSKRSRKNPISRKFTDRREFQRQDGGPIRKHYIMFSLHRMGVCFIVLSTLSKNVNRQIKAGRPSPMLKLWSKS